MAYGEYNGIEMLLHNFLFMAGEEGWELVGTVIAAQYYVTSQMALSGWADVPHRLYFKRPKT